MDGNKRNAHNWEGKTGATQISFHLSIARKTRGFKFSSKLTFGYLFFVSIFSYLTLFLFNDLTWKREREMRKTKMITRRVTAFPLVHLRKKKLKENNIQRI